MGLRSQRHLLSKSENKWSQLPSVPPRINKSNGVSNILQKTELCDLLYIFFSCFKGNYLILVAPGLNLHIVSMLLNLVVSCKKTFWVAKYRFQIESDIKNK